jgi:hypothetical protein
MLGMSESANPPKQAGVNRIARASVMAVEDDNLGREVANFGNHVPALKPDHVPLKPDVVHPAYAHRPH